MADLITSHKKLIVAQGPLGRKIDAMSKEQEVGADSSKKNKRYEIVVNGRLKEVTEDEMSFLQIVRLEFPDAVFNDTTIYTVTYKRGHGNKPEGTMVDGDTVKIKEGMIFNVTPTDKS